ncbi:hypothetical protein Scep_005067 [Stephania cephalantha]|uniref:Uncharacterized protein n=1 Tax=Stephania cephalantha TaxID=152367 RepID=A0AAP0KV05_9MAGN
MVCKQHELSVEKIMSPMLHGLYHCIELHIVCVIPQLRPRQLLTEIGNRPIILTQDSSNAYLGCITMQLKR